MCSLVIDINIYESSNKTGYSEVFIKWVWGVLTRRWPRQIYSVVTLLRLSTTVIEMLNILLFLIVLNQHFARWKSVLIVLAHTLMLSLNILQPQTFTITCNKATRGKGIGDRSFEHHKLWKLNLIVILLLLHTDNLVKLALFNPDVWVIQTSFRKKYWFLLLY